jgi:hypothetical protein
MVTTVGLSPMGTINRFGILPSGATVETVIVGPITVPSQDEHHLTDFHVGVAKGSVLTLFRIYYQPVGAAGFTEVDEIPIGDYGSNVLTLSTSIRVKAGEAWKVTVSQGTPGRVTLRVGGQTKIQDSRD